MKPQKSDQVILNKSNVKNYDFLIDNLCTHSCPHQLYYSYNNKNFICTQLCSSVIDCYSKGETLSDNTIDKFFTFICKVNNYYGTIDISCINKNSKVLIKNRLEFSCTNDDGLLVDNMMKYIELTTENLYLLCGCRSEILSNALSG